MRWRMMLESHAWRKITAERRRTSEFRQDAVSKSMVPSMHNGLGHVSSRRTKPCTGDLSRTMSAGSTL